MKVYVVHTVSTPVGEGVVWAVCRTKASAEKIAKECEGADIEEFYLSGGEDE